MSMEKIVALLEKLCSTPIKWFVLIALTLCICVLCTIIAVSQWISQRRKEIVLGNSDYYKNALALKYNTAYYREIAGDGKVFHVLHVNSKAKFDRTEAIESLNDYLSLHGSEMTDLLDKVSENRRIYRTYITDFEALSSTITPEACEELRINFDKFRKIEQEMVDMEKLNMIQSLSITCNVEYTSPKGQNHYKKGCTYLESEIRTAMKDMITRAEYMQSEAWRRKNERSKVTPSLRYDVMRRDGFCCCLCGRSARNGAELEVDHIMPVSKGGNTTYSNLQTLCRECNRGKGAKTLE